MWCYWGGVGEGLLERCVVLVRGYWGGVWCYWGGVGEGLLGRCVVCGVIGEVLVRSSEVRTNWKV